jgi:hypothetical protein
MLFQTHTGVAEAFLASNCDAAELFARNYSRLQDALQALADRSRKGEVAQLTPAPASLTKPAVPRLPPLPNVGGAHEYTALAAALIGALGIASWWATRPIPPPSRITSTGEIATPPLAETRISPPVARAPDVAAGPDKPLPLPMPPPRPSSASPTQSPTPTQSLQPLERVATLQAANIRAGPSGTAAVVRTAARGATFKVFGRSSGWVQVGDTEPVGWIYSGLLEPAQ